MSLPPSPSEALTTLADIAHRLGAVGQPHLLSDRADAVVGRIGDLVLKAHPVDTDTAALRTRLHLAANPLLHRILLPPTPVDGDLLTIRAARVYTAWPYGEPVDPDDPDAAPWAAAATLLARLHNCPWQPLVSANESVVSASDRGVTGEPGPSASPPTARPSGSESSGSDFRASESAASASDLRPSAGESTACANESRPSASGSGASAQVVDKAAGYATVPAVHGGVPASGAVDRIRRALRRLRAAGGVANPAAAEVVWRAFGGLPALDHGDTPASTPASAAASRHLVSDADAGESAAPVRRQTLIHGDFHLGQLVRLRGDTLPPRADATHPASAAPPPLPTGATPLDDHESRWRLVDVDDMGIGDPVWDLARPAGFFAAGILDPAAWERFLGAYIAAGGPAIAPHTDVWAALDIPARALVVQSAAIAVAKSGEEGRELDELEVALIDACRRMPAAVW
ncbi:phosphotransferase family protein [Nocardia sp. NPDC050406]|uniref:phosphotransferase family protein n=1 Tax=Nocardia sp. NPDC050406 TaxID=3364318 RepID=UPI0037A4BA7D